MTITAPATTLLGYQYRSVITNTAGITTTTPAPLIVGTSTSKLTWLQNNFTPTQLGNPAIVADSATPAADGIPNLVKYAFNLNPLVNAQPNLPHPLSVSGNLVLSFSAIQSDLAYSVQSSTDLVHWSNMTTQTNGPQITATQAVSTNSPVFLRIVVTPFQ